MKNKPFFFLCSFISLSLLIACEDKDVKQSNKNNNKVVAFVNYDKIKIGKHYEITTSVKAQSAKHKSAKS